MKWGGSFLVPRPLAKLRRGRRIVTGGGALGPPDLCLRNFSQAVDFPAPMSPRRRSDREIRDQYAYVGIGMSFAAGVVMFTLGGWLLDRWLGWTPVLTVAGAVIGAIAGTLWVYARLRAEEDDGAAGRSGREH